MKTKNIFKLLFSLTIVFMLIFSGCTSTEDKQIEAEVDKEVTEENIDSVIEDELVTDYTEVEIGELI